MSGVRTSFGDRVAHSLLVMVAVAQAASAQSAASSPFVNADALIPPMTTMPIGLGDFDGDGDADLLGAGPPFVVLNDGTGRFVPLVPGPGAVGPPSVLSVTIDQYAVADFDGDGKSDVARYGGGVATAWISLGGPAGFVAASLPAALGGLPSGSVVAGIVAGDIDGDGRADLVVRRHLPSTGAGYNPTTPLVLLAQAGGGFLSSGALGLTAAASLRSFLLVDVDLDGDRDALIGGGGVFYNTAGFFGPLVGPDGGSSPVDTTFATLRTANFDGDAFPDLLATGVSQIVVHLGGAAGFTTGPIVPLAIPGSQPFVAGVGVDPDGDGVDELRVFQNDGRATSYAFTAGGFALIGTEFAACTGLAAVLDLDGDGDRDLIHGASTAAASAIGGVLESTFVVRLNDGAGHLAFTDVLPPLYLRSGPAVGDYDGDGDEDLAGFITDGASATLVLGVNDGFGAFAWITSGLPPLQGVVNPGRLTVGDFDGDGDDDLQLLDWVVVPVPPSGAMTVQSARTIFNLGLGAFSAGPTTNLVGGGIIHSAVVADFDADGFDDVAETVLSAANSVRMYFGSPAGLGSPVAIATPSGATELVVGDFAGNSLPDLAFAGTPCGLLRNEGAGVFVVELPFGAATAGRVNTADLDADGLSDLSFNHQIFVRVGAAWVFVGTASNGNSPFIPLGVQAFDFEGDGDVDLVSDSGLVVVSGPGGQTSSSLAALPFGPHVLVRDFDHDGDLDLLAATRTNGGAFGGGGSGVGGVPKLFFNRSRQLTYDAPLRPGRSAAFGVHGAPGGAWWLYAALGTAVDPLPPLGISYLSPASTVLLTGGSLDSAGRASLSASLPASYAALSGVEIDLQALVDTAAGPRLTNARRAVILGY